MAFCLNRLDLDNSIKWSLGHRRCKGCRTRMSMVSRLEVRSPILEDTSKPEASSHCRLRTLHSSPSSSLLSNLSRLVSIPSYPRHCSHNRLVSMGFPCPISAKQRHQRPKCHRCHQCPHSPPPHHCCRKRQVRRLQSDSERQQQTNWYLSGQGGRIWHRQVSNLHARPYESGLTDILAPSNPFGF